MFVNTQAAGAAVAIIRGGPGRASVFSIKVEDLNAGRVIDNEQPVFPVNGGCPRPDAIAIAHLALAPNQVRSVRRTAPRESERKYDQSSANSIPRHVGSLPEREGIDNCVGRRKVSEASSMYR